MPIEEQIQPNQRIERGFVSFNKPGPSGLEALALALEPAGRGITTAIDNINKTVEGELQAKADRGLQRELARVQDILSGPDPSPEELEELLFEVEHPEARILIENRTGSLAVEDALPNIEERLQAAGDMIETREIGRQIQQELMEEFGVSPGIRAGIAQRLSEVIPPAMTRASIRRRNFQEQEDINLMGTNLESSLVNGTGAFASSLQGILDDETTTQQPASRLNKVLLNTLEAFYLEGVSSTNPDHNLNTRRATNAVNVALEIIPDAETKRRLNEFKNKIAEDRFNFLSSADSTAAELAKTSYAAQLGSILDVPDDQVIPDTMAAPFLATANATQDRVIITTARSIIDAHNERASRGLSNNVHVKNARERLENDVREKIRSGGVFVAFGDFKPGGEEALELFEEVVAAMPPEAARDNIELIRSLDRLENSALKRAEVIEKAEEAARAEEKERLQNQFQELNFLRSHGIGFDTARARELEVELSRSLDAAAERRRNDEILRYAAEKNIELGDIIRTWER